MRGDGGCYCNTGVAESKARSCGGWKNGSTCAEGKGRVGEVLSGCTMTTNMEAVGHQLFQRRNDVEESVRFR